MPLFSANPFCLDLVPYGLRSALRALWGEVSSRPPGPVKTQPRGLVDSDSPHPAPPPPSLVCLPGSLCGASASRVNNRSSLPSSSESTRSYRRGGRSLEDSPSARQPLCSRRHIPVGALVYALKCRCLGCRVGSRTGREGRETSFRGDNTVG
jgi:hypothetical protein